MCDAMKDVVHASVAHVQEQKSALYRGKYKKKHWWNTDCLQARDRQRFWHKLWDSIGRPREGHVHTCYKLAKKAYRSVCRTAVNVNVHQSYRQMEFYLGVRSIKKFWNLIRRSKCTSGSTVSDITLDTLHDYYSKKFSRNDQDVSETIRNAECIVNQKYVAAKDNVHLDFTKRESMLLEYMGKLRTGCAAGIDGITGEHIKWAKKTKLISMLCDMLTLCVRFGIVPESFTKGLLIPLLKKPNIDPTVSKNYRPIVISTTFSKLMEIHILNVCGEHEFHDLQFGFVASRGTAMAAALTHDIIDYCVSNGSPVYVCALDAEGAFDGIPHAVTGVVPTLYWRLLVYWYSRLVVYIK